MMRKRSPYGHQRHNNNRGGQMRRNNHRHDGQGAQYDQHEDELHVSPRARRHAQVQREKYVNLAIDARRSGDRVQAEYYLQHADHYQRVLNAAQEQFSQRDQQHRDDRNADRDDADDTSLGGLDTSVSHGAYHTPHPSQSAPSHNDGEEGSQPEHAAPHERRDYRNPRQRPYNAQRPSQQYQSQSYNEAPADDTGGDAASDNDDTYAPSYGTTQEPRQRPQQAQGGERRPRGRPPRQPQSARPSVQTDLQDVLPMPKPSGTSYEEGEE